MSEVKIIPARPEDYRAIAEIYNEAIHKGNASMEEAIKSEADIAGWVSKFHARERLYAQVKGDDVVGWGIIKRYSDREGYRFACETAVYLRQSETRKGYGSAMKKHLITEARSMDYHHLVAKIFAINESSIQYNLQLGYTIVGTQKEIGFKNGQWMDIVIMQLVL
ncbi:MAG TPA: N-acetyltransferase [Cytophagales bacterium]|nr:N-acetyltransferase [Cytophagales bacterium]HAA24177.1 N-acetyltransferase [Cytophagales bacterium]HAP60974.1 N-acetyltransferase [Cytophagales bacterium]